MIQATVGGIFPLLLAYRREMNERAAFLTLVGIRCPERKAGDYFLDALVCGGAVVMGVGFMAALSMALPELPRFPVILAKGWDARLRH